MDFGGFWWIKSACFDIFPWLPQGFRLTFPTQHIVACKGRSTHQDGLDVHGDDTEVIGISMGLYGIYSGFIH